VSAITARRSPHYYPGAVRHNSPFPSSEIILGRVRKSGIRSVGEGDRDNWATRPGESPGGIGGTSTAVG